MAAATSCSAGAPGPKATSPAGREKWGWPSGAAVKSWCAKRCHVHTWDPNQQTPGLREAERAHLTAAPPGRPLKSFFMKISHIGKLRDFLLEHRKDYINAYSHITSEYGKMTDTERDQIDQDAQTFMRTCSEAIQQLRAQAHKEIHSQQVKEHRSAVLDFIEDYLKRVCKLYSEQRAIRVKRVVDKKRLSKLEPEPNTKTKESMFSEKVSQNPKDSEEKPITEEYPEKIPAEAQPELRSWGDGRGEDELSPEEIQMFEQENQRLIGEMNSLFDEVRQIEGKVVEISRLQEIFTEKVLQQEAEIDSIHQLVVGATENIKEGNEDIREAIKNNAGFRVWVLFFLVMCSFSLLFLDWYDS
ncbi:syntaxin-18 isoform X3 [Equus asinus]|uniref:syntaxin-18 isoform X3 n=1 Tax=Equus asinus TaxID=9793 RepID=UPI0038F6AE5E